MKYTKLATTFLFVGMLMLSGCGSSDTADTTPPVTTTPPTTGDTTPPVTGSTAPVTHETSVLTTSGESIPVQSTTEGFNFIGYEGKPVLLEFYGDTCPHCVDAIPSYNNLQAKYGNDILILTIDAPGPFSTLDNAGLQAFVASHGITYRTVSQENQGNMKAYAEELVGVMPGVPYVLILNRNGVITSQYLGPNESQLEAAILDVL